MKCPKCGKSMAYSGEHKVYFCTNCGERVRPDGTPPKEVTDKEMNGEVKEEIVDASSFNAPYKSFAGKFGAAVCIVSIFCLIFGIIMATAKLSLTSTIFFAIVLIISCIIWDILLICLICGIVIDKYHRQRMAPMIKKIEELENKLAELEKDDTTKVADSDKE